MCLRRRRKTNASVSSRRRATTPPTTPPIKAGLLTPWLALALRDCVRFHRFVENPTYLAGAEDSTASGGTNVNEVAESMDTIFESLPVFLMVRVCSPSEIWFAMY